jgi:hypothetical protein
VSPGGGNQTQWYHPASLSSESGESLCHSVVMRSPCGRFLLSKYASVYRVQNSDKLASALLRPPGPSTQVATVTTLPPAVCHPVRLLRQAGTRARQASASWAYQSARPARPSRLCLPRSSPPALSPPSPPRSLVCDGQTSPHRPRLVVSRRTCPPLSPERRRRKPPCVLLCVFITALPCVFITAVPIVKLFARGEGDSGGHVLRAEACVD